MIINYLLFIILLGSCLSKRIINKNKPNTKTKYLHFWSDYNCSGNDIIINNIEKDICYNMKNNWNDTILSLNSSPGSLI